MSAIECRREQDVVDAVTSGRWPDRAEEDLRSHVAQCGICHDVADVACALQTDHERRWQDARVPSAGLVWWRAEMRARAEATRAAARPMVVAEGIAAVCAVVFAATLFGLALPWVLSSNGWLNEATTIMRTPAFGLPLVLALGACIVLAPVAVYLALSDQ